MLLLILIDIGLASFLRPRAGVWCRLGHLVRLGLRRSLVLLLDRRPDLFAVHGQLARRLDADANRASRYLHDLYDGAVAYNDPFAGAAGDDEHVSSLESFEGLGASGRGLDGNLREQRRADIRVGDLVDHL